MVVAQFGWGETADPAMRDADSRLTEIASYTTGLENDRSGCGCRMKNARATGSGFFVCGKLTTQGRVNSGDDLLTDMNTEIMGNRPSGRPCCETG